MPGGKRGTTSSTVSRAQVRMPCSPGGGDFLAVNAVSRVTPWHNVRGRRSSGAWTGAGASSAGVNATCTRTRLG